MLPERQFKLKPIDTEAVPTADDESDEKPPPGQEKKSDGDLPDTVLGTARGVGH
jgi:hypothetical protein